MKRASIPRAKKRTGMEKFKEFSAEVLVDGQSEPLKSKES
jgi:hypothetical protein